jgi:DNA polymerase epsilon subunit 1
VTLKPKIAIVNRKVAEQPPKEKQLPDPSISYSAWLKVIRPRWKERREERHGIAGAPAAVPSMFRGVKTRASTSWDIIQICPTERDGRFRMWLAVDSEIVQVKLRVSREFYLNLKAAAANDFFLTNYSATEISRSLPRNHPSPHLYKITVSEDTFRHESSHFAYIMNNPVTDGVYETQVNPILQAFVIVAHDARRLHTK